MRAEPPTAGPVARRLGGGTRTAGPGSVFSKTLRDSRRAIVLAAGLFASFIVVGALALAFQFGTEADRRLLAVQAELFPALFRGLLGEPIAIDRLGGFISWRIGNVLPPFLGLWSVLALSGTLAGEARQGSLDVLASTPLSRRSIALQKLVAHLVGLTLVVLAIAGAMWLSGIVFAVLPGDAIDLADALAHAAWVGLASLPGGAIAFGLAPLVGRATAAGAGGAALYAAYVLNGFRDVVVGFDVLSAGSWLTWTASHRPLAGVTDWPSLAVVAAFSATWLAAGVVAFERRDLGAVIGGPSARPLFSFGLGGPIGRSFADRLPAAIGWGAGIGLYGWMIAISSRAFSEQLATIPGIERLIEQFYPEVDVGSAAGFLQLAFFGFALLLIALATATLVGGWAGDEADRRLDVILSTPLSRIRYAVGSWLGVLAALAVMTLLIAVGVGLGAAGQGDDPTGPFVGVFVGGLYAAGLAGVGFAVGGTVRSGLAGAVVAGLAIGFYLLDFVGGALRLPDELLDLALNRHLGQPMTGSFDPLGLGVSVALVIGGVLVGAWGLERRDLRT